jgi:hypothetical protein
VITDISNQSTYNGGQLGPIQGFIFHHTGGGGTPQGVVNTLNQRHLGVQYVMDRDGSIYRTLPPGAQGAHIQNSPNTPLNNTNTEGMEVIAQNDHDVTPAQVASAKTFAQGYVQQHPGVSIYGHGEVNPGHKEADEGGTITNAVRAIPNIQIANAGMVNHAVTATPTATAEADIPFTLPANAPMGMGNNNPLNMKYREGLPYADVVGPSKNTDQGDPQFVFKTPQAGWNAAYQLINKKYTSGMLTPNQLIAGQGGWTPGNLQAAANVAKTMGIGPDDDIRFTNPAQAKSFMKALVTQEQGQAGQAYPDAMIERAISGKFPSGAPSTTTPASTAPASTTPGAVSDPRTQTPQAPLLTPAQSWGQSLGATLANLGRTMGGGGSAPVEEVPDQPPIRTLAMETPAPQTRVGGELGSQLGNTVLPNITDPTVSITQGAPSMTQMLNYTGNMPVSPVGTDANYNYFDPRRTVTPSMTNRGVRLG